jgi:hypothetical protein
MAAIGETHDDVALVDGLNKKNNIKTKKSIQKSHNKKNQNKKNQNKKNQNKKNQNKKNQNKKNQNILVDGLNKTKQKCFSYFKIHFNHSIRLVFLLEIPIFRVNMLL